MDNLLVIKIGGNVVDDESRLDDFLQQFAGLACPKILVHGGGMLATRMAEELGIKQQMVNGRRITDEETLKVVTMVYAGTINKEIVVRLQSLGANAIGFTGADGNAVLAHKREVANIDYGWVGDVDRVNSGLFKILVINGFVPVVAPITHNGKGQLLNTNADTIAQEIAAAMAQKFDVSLIYCFEKAGVLRATDDESSVITSIDPSVYDQLKKDGTISHGMIPKLDNAFQSLASGVDKVVIGKAENLYQLVNGSGGTTVSNE